jgi:hypothetical protein
MRLMSQIRDWLRAAENVKTGYRWLILTFFATWWFWSFPVQAEKDRSYGRTALIEVAPPSDFLPTTALLDNGALQCPSADAFAIIQSNTLWMREIFSTRKTGVERMRRETTLNCRTTDREQIVQVLTIYNLLLSGHPLENRTIARVRSGSGDEHYVDVGALYF